ncbi:MAG: hypothetical protein PHT16_02920 [Candidatus Pacebacteria bacterium]|nr:hypothetical protein [Candidatus Paceibacterota bacterium]
MLNESLFLSSFDELKNLLLHELTIFHVAIVYVLMYVVYKALGRYIYFKPQEHASKVNRTFLTLSLLVVLLHGLDGLNSYLPFLPEYRWLYMICGLIILIAPLSILMDRVIWKYDNHGYKSRRKWHYDFLPINKDYFKTSITKSESNGTYSHEWEEEAVESTSKNIHSDALLNVLALIIFIVVSGKWAYNSATEYGYLPYVFFGITCLTITGIFLDCTLFSWIYYLEKNIKTLFKR